MNDILVKCAEKAYLDLCRTIKFNTDNRGTRKSAKRKICEMLVHEYDVLENAVKGSDERQSAFDREHQRICEEIINTYSEISELTYGQAQKVAEYDAKICFDDGGGLCSEKLSAHSCG